MPLHLPRLARRIVHRAALPWLVAAAWLTVAWPAAGQQNRDVQRPQPHADAGYSVDEWAVLSNRDEMEREISVWYPGRGSRVTDQVLLRFRILSDGRVDSTSVFVVRASSPALAAPAVKLARRLRFVPATANGRPVPIWTEFPLYLPLSDGSGVQQGTIDREPALRNAGEVMRQIALRYPPALRDRGIVGSVLLRLKVTGEGTVDPSSISMKQATDIALVEPATLVARQMRFIPAMAHGEPAQTWITLPVHFAPPVERVAPPDEGTYVLSAVEEEPQLVNRREIARELSRQYPPALRDSLVAGDVVMRFRILENGTVDPESISVESATRPAFGAAARPLIAAMRFLPAKVGGRAVKVWVSVPIHFEVQVPPPVQGDTTRARTATPPAGVRP